MTAKADKSPEMTPREGRPRLGRGLAALLGDAKPETDGREYRGVKQIPIEFVRSNPRNPRQVFHEDELEELAASIRERGIIQPIIVRPVAGISDAYEIVAGERRWRAAQRAGQHTVPVISMSLPDKEALEISIVENIQRSDLNAIEEARGFAQLSAEYGYNHTDIGRVVGKSRSHVANTLRLLGLPEHTRGLLSKGEISAGHARALLGTPNPDAVADRIVSQGLSVRDVENLSDGAKPSAPSPETVPDRDPATRDLENRLSLSLGAKAIIHNSKRLKEIKIRFTDFEQLEHLCQKLLRE